MEAALKDGLEVDRKKNELRVNLNPPRLVTVRATNTLTHLEKTYILKVTEKGICLL